jgi:hypothetical protein
MRSSAGVLPKQLSISLAAFAGDTDISTDTISPAKRPDLNDTFLTNTLSSTPSWISPATRDTGK